MNSKIKIPSLRGTRIRVEGPTTSAVETCANAVEDMLPSNLESLSHDPDSDVSTSSHSVEARVANTADILPGSPTSRREQQLTALDEIGACDACLKLIAGFPDVIATAVLRKSAGGVYQLSQGTWTGFYFEREVFRKAVSLKSIEAAQSGECRAVTLNDAAQCVTFCLPVTVNSQRCDVIAVSVKCHAQQAAGYDLRSFLLAASSLAIWHRQRRADELDWQVRATAAVVEIVRTISTSSTLDRGCHGIVSDLQTFLGVDRVAVSLVDRSGLRTRLVTVNGISSIRKDSDVAQGLQSVADETLVRDSNAAWPILSPTLHHNTLALRRFQDEHRYDSVVSLPLSFEAGPQKTRHVVGVLTLAGPRIVLHRPEALAFLDAASPSIAIALDGLRRSQGGPIAKFTRKMLSGSHLKLAAASIAAIALFGAMSLEVPVRIHTAGTLEAEVRRVISAPYDGLLEISLAEPGDLVGADEILARMDSREIRWELSSLVAEKAQAQKELDRSLAVDDVAKAQLSALEAERLDQKSRLLQYREDNHELRSPLGGMVLKGSLDRMTSAPVKLGQPLFEVGELDPLRLDVEIPAEEFSRVRTGHEVTVRFEGIANRDVVGSLKSIRPRSELRNGRNVFIGEVVVPNPDHFLRPGLRGSVTIRGDRQTLGASLFRRAWESGADLSNSMLVTDVNSSQPSPSEPTSLIAAERRDFDRRDRARIDREHNDGLRTPSQGVPEPFSRVAESPSETVLR